MISHKHKFIFIHIPRTAGSSVEHALQDETCTLLPNEWDRTRVMDAPLNHLTLQQIRDHEFVPTGALKRYFNFCFVRNPWDRAVSEMFYLRRINCLSGRDHQEGLMQLCELESIGNHVRLQFDFVTCGSGIDVDFIGRYENLQGDFDRVCDIVGIPRRILPLTNVLNREPYWKYFNAQTRRLVSEKYRIDLEKFQYEFC